MQSIISTSDMHCPFNSPFYFRGDEDGTNGANFVDLEELQLTADNVFEHHEINSVSSSTSSIRNEATKVPSVCSDLQIGGLIISSSQIEEWIIASSGVVANTHNTNQERQTVVDSKERSKGKIENPKQVQRRLAQNREAAMKSRMRKKAHVQHLENSQQSLAQPEDQLKIARQQGNFVTSGFSADRNHTIGANGVSPFDLDYARWLEEHQQLINDLRSALNSQANESELRCLVNSVMSHYDEMFRLKTTGAKLNLFYILSGTWKTPTERCFLWLGGLRCSEILKIIENQIQPLTEEQMVGICNLQLCSQQNEDALSQVMEALQNSLAEALSSNSGNVSDYMGQMAIAMDKCVSLENLLHQADLLRRQTLQQLQQILTTVQTARALLAINDYNSRLRDLNSLWFGRPRE